MILAPKMSIFLGIVARPCSYPSSLIPIPRSTLPCFTIKYTSISLPRNGFSQFSHYLRASSLHSDSSITSQDGPSVSIEQPEIIFTGTGTSEGIPRVSCLTDPMKTCTVCTKALEPCSKNRRLNTGLLIRYPRLSRTRNIVIDVGKFFYHSALKWFPSYGIRTIDAVLITHSHADAIGGLDDLRDWTKNVQTTCIPIYVAKRDFEVMKKTHYYLVDTSVIIPGATVSHLQFNIIREDPFVVHDLKFTPLPVWHGNGYRSLGFRFGNICYISDVSEIPEETYGLLVDCDLLILDALRPDRSSSTHFGLPRALEEVRKIKPKRTLFTGMMHLMDHDKINEDLARLKESEGLDVQLSYDGLRGIDEVFVLTCLELTLCSSRMNHQTKNKRGHSPTKSSLSAQHIPNRFLDGSTIVSLFGVLFVFDWQMCEKFMRYSFLYFEFTTF